MPGLKYLRELFYLPIYFYQAYVLAANLHTQEFSDRKRAFIVATSRNKKQLKGIHYDLKEALEYTSRNNIDVHAFGLGTKYGWLISMLIFLIKMLNLAASF